MELIVRVRAVVVLALVTSFGAEPQPEEGFEAVVRGERRRREAKRRLEVQDFIVAAWEVEKLSGVDGSCFLEETS